MASIPKCSPKERLGWFVHEIHYLPIIIHLQAMACKRRWLEYESGLPNKLLTDKNKLRSNISRAASDQALTALMKNGIRYNHSTTCSCARRSPAFFLWYSITVELISASSVSTFTRCVPIWTRISPNCFWTSAMSLWILVWARLTGRLFHVSDRNFRLDIGVGGWRVRPEAVAVALLADLVRLVKKKWLLAFHGVSACRSHSPEEKQCMCNQCSEIQQLVVDNLVTCVINLFFLHIGHTQEEKIFPGV